MIDRSTLPKISEILSRLDVPPGRRGRTRCPIHGGTNSQAFSYSDEKGTWYCFRCAFGGDVIALVQKAIDTDFKGALRWLGIEPGKPPAPDPAVVRRQKAREGLKAWTKQRGRMLRDDIYVRELYITAATRRLQRDPEDTWGWNWLAWAYTGLEALVHEHDLILGRECDQVQAYREWRAAA